MNWNKSNTILIIAFIIVNIFLLLVVYNGRILQNDYPALKEEFILDVISKLEEKDIITSCEVPKKNYTLPFLEIEYKTIIPEKELIENFLGNNVEVKDNVFEYENSNGEKIKIFNNKKLIYIKRKPIKKNKANKNDREKQAQDFLIEKNISLEGYNKILDYQNETQTIIYSLSHKEFSVENSYIKVHLDDEGVYMIEMQQIKSVKETVVNIKITSAPEALLRLIVNENNYNKKIINIELCYYTKEDEGWDKIVKTNADPTWKVIFDDGSWQYLVEED